MTETILAKRYGEYREYAVVEPVAGVLCCAWMHRAPQGEPGGRIAVVPDACVDLIWTEHGFFIAGPDRTASFPSVSPGETILGLRFRPGTARHLLHCDLDALTGQMVEFDAIRPGGLNAHHERLLATEGPLNRLHLLQALFAADMPIAPAVRPDAAALYTLSTRLPADAMAAEIGVSARTLRRLSVAEFGYGPKTLARILRLQRLLGRMAEPDTALAGLAAESGFADQAHMNRDVLALTSLTPGEILRQMRG